MRRAGADGPGRDINRDGVGTGPVGFRPVKAGETIIKQGRANHWVTPENAQGGRLVLTAKRLIFTAHAANFGRGRWVIENHKIASARLGDGLTALTLELNDGSSERFVVFGRRKWMQSINEIAAGRNE